MNPPPIPVSSPGQRVVRVLIAVAMCVAPIGAIWWLAVRPAALEPFLPQCIFFRLTGLLCPGCGGTRAADALIHGRLLHALRSNPFTALALPVLLIVWFRWAYQIATGRPGTSWSIRMPPLLLVAIPVLLTLFTILRNIPHPAFDLLRPIAAASP